MKHERIFLHEEKAYLDTYFQEMSAELKLSVQRPCILICPGGGYQMTTDREAEPIALAFSARGFQTAILRYPVAPSRFPESLFCLAEAVAWLRTHAEENRIDSMQITVCGFSAGGHLAASLGVFWNQDSMWEGTSLNKELIRPNRLLLGYPVITSGEYAHLNSFDQLLGTKANEQQRELVSLEKHVTSFTPPTFLWHTFEDQIVPVENSLLFAVALRKKHVPFELHIYSEGVHGLALANELTMDSTGGVICKSCEGWLELACAWLNRPVKAYIKRDETFSHTVPA